MYGRLIGFLVVVVALGACSGDGAGPTSTVAPTVLVTTTPAPPATAATAAPGPTDTTPSSTVASTTTSTTSVPLVPLDELELEFVAIATGFGQPVLVTTAPNDDRLFVVDQPGVIWLLDGDEPVEFLDIQDQVAFRGERGLLGLTFHPDYERNGRFFVNYINNSGDTVVAEFLAEGDVADVESRRLIIKVEQPASNHNGGMIGFGPDGYLWIGTGDGGGANDQFDQARRADTLLGALLRLDVDSGGRYAIPPSNPYADGVGGAPEVWATGLRNPWRWSFDGDRIIIGDVGQNQIEEIDVAPVSVAGLDYGWSNMEGSTCFRTSDCETAGQVLPAIEYSHSDGCSVTGGYVYRGSAIPELAGHYFYGDYCNGWVRSAVIEDNGTVGEIYPWFGARTLGSLTSFGVDGDGELYATTADGTVWKLERA